MTYWLVFKHLQYDFTVIQLWKNKEPGWIEFRGDGLQQWTDFNPNTKSQAQRLHDGLIGPHSSVLHAGDRLAILPRHEDYEFVKKAYINEFVADEDCVSAAYGFRN